MLQDAKRKKLVKISIIPLIDVIFLMLVFFMLATNFDNSKVVNLKIKTNLQSSDNKSNPLILNIDKNDYKINDIIFSNLQIEAEIITKWKTGLFDNIIILNDQESELEYLVFILDILKKNQIDKVTFSDDFKY
tara:strand:- start:576 stop:974 length:399 start_codon:yes stop_codon:yes gene_type:complete